MLAEPRRRQKYSINPRGLDWSNDDSKVGQKILEKMGWRKGKALGLNEDGCKEHIKVSVRSDRKGVGCTQQHCDNWIAHQEDFNSILSSLNKNVNTQSSTATFSLSNKSKNSRSRVHYQKFTKGKDLSGYHSTDLNCIFGERQKNLARPEQQRTDEGDLESSSQNGEGNRSFGVLTVTSSTSMDHYFAAKLANVGNKSKKNKPVSEAVSESSNDIMPTCSVTVDKDREQTQQLVPATGVAVSCDVAVRKCKKKKRKTDKDCHPNDERLHSKSLDANEISKKKKKKKHRDTESAEITLDCSSDKQNVSTAETTRKNKKRPPSAGVNLLEHSSVPSTKGKQSCHTR